MPRRLRYSSTTLSRASTVACQIVSAPTSGHGSTNLCRDGLNRFFVNGCVVPSTNPRCFSSARMSTNSQPAKQRSTRRSLSPSLTERDGDKSPRPLPWFGEGQQTNQPEPLRRPWRAIPIFAALIGPPQRLGWQSCAPWHGKNGKASQDFALEG